MIEDNNKMRCIAAVDIKKGEKLAITYVELIMPGVLRRKLLKKVKKLPKIAYCGNYVNLISQFFDKNFVKPIVLLKNFLKS